MLFCIDDYKTLVKSFKAGGYSFKTFSAAHEKNHVVVMRHDVDFSVEYAAKLAELESDLGITAVYFFLLASPFYNVMDPKIRKSILRIKKLGHVISLHFDISEGAQSIHLITERLRFEIHLFEALFDCKIEVVSFHRPAKYGLLSELQKIVMSTYDKAFVEDMFYCSDSRGEWFYGHPISGCKYKNRESMQILTHPIWWVNELPTNRVECLKAFVNSKKQETLCGIFENTDFVSADDFG